MKSPEEYSEWWLRMWPSYFHLPERTLDPTTGLIVAEDNAPAEKFKVGDKVQAIMKIKWFGGGGSTRTMAKIEGKEIKHYYDQLYEEKSGWSSSGSKYKVIAGMTGTIKAMYTDFPGWAESETPPKHRRPMLAVAWDEMDEDVNLQDKVFRTEPEQVVAVP